MFMPRNKETAAILVSHTIIWELTVIFMKFAFCSVNQDECLSRERKKELLTKECIRTLGTCITILSFRGAGKCPLTSVRLRTGLPDGGECVTPGETYFKWGVSIPDNVTPRRSHFEFTKTFLFTEKPTFFLLLLFFFIDSVHFRCQFSLLAIS